MVRFTSVYLVVPNSNEVAVCYATLTVNMFISTNIIKQDNYNCSLCVVQDVWALDNKNVASLYLCFVTYLVISNDLRVHCRWEVRQVFDIALYKYKSGGDDWRSWILHSDFKCILSWIFWKSSSENGQIMIYKALKRGCDLVSKTMKHIPTACIFCNIYISLEMLD